MSNIYKTDDAKDRKDTYNNSYNNSSHILQKELDNATSLEIRTYNDFMDMHNKVMPRNDPDRIIWEQCGGGRSLSVKDNNLEQMFEAYDDARKVGYVMHTTEKQNEQASCIMVDFDIKQKSDQRVINLRHVNKFINEYLKILHRVCDVPSDLFVPIYCTLRPAVESITDVDDLKDYFKDGIHLYFMVKISRTAKQYILHTIKQEEIIENIFAADFPDKYDEILDMQCAHVPTLLYGSCKENKTPYTIWQVYSGEFKNNIEAFPDELFEDFKDSLNLSKELSINVEGNQHKKPFIPIRENMQKEVNATIMKMTHRGKFNKAIDDTCDALETLIISNDQARQLKHALDLIDISRCNNRSTWQTIVSVLLNESKDYEPLARYWSMKSTLYGKTDGDFDTLKLELEDKRNAPHINYIFKLARQDNKNAMDKLNLGTACNVLIKKLSTKMAQGNVGSNTFATASMNLLKDRFIACKKGKQIEWYEFKINHKGNRRIKSKVAPGHLWKWINTEGEPFGLYEFLADELVNGACAQVYDYLEKSRKKADTDGKLKWANKIIDGFGKCVNRLEERTCRSNIIRDLAGKLNDVTFLSEINTNPMLMGVGQGILELDMKGGPVKLIEQYHSHKITQFTTTKYKRFDPYDPLTIRLLKTFRNIHMPDQTDVHEYKMYRLAATIDNQTKDSVLFVMYGVGRNGKTLVCEYHAAALGSDHYSTKIPGKMFCENGARGSADERPSSTLMKLEGTRYYFADELPNNPIFKMFFVKELTSGGNLVIREMGEATQRGGISINTSGFVATNFRPIITEKSVAVYDRIQLAHHGVIFRDKHLYDEKNPNHRLKNNEIGDKGFINRPDVRSAYLSIMTFYHRKLMSKYEGVLANIPKPNIDRVTMKWRNENDHITNFITKCFTKNGADIEHETQSLEKVVEMYIKWYNKNIQETRLFAKKIRDEFLTSKISKKIEKSITGNSVITNGYRFINEGDEMEIGDVKIYSDGTDSKGKTIYEKEYDQFYQDETPDEYILRVQAEWTQMNIDFPHVKETKTSFADPFYNDCNPDSYSSSALPIHKFEKKERKKKRLETVNNFDVSKPERNSKNISRLIDTLTSSEFDLDINLDMDEKKKPSKFIKKTRTETISDQDVQDIMDFI